MIYKTAREILRNAKTIANADNSAFTDFYLNTNLLNNAYRDIYDILVSHGNYFTKTINISNNTILPEDCYDIISITDMSGNIIPVSSPLTHQYGYIIENNQYKGPTGMLRYSTIPATITAPDEWEEVEKDYSEYYTDATSLDGSIKDDITFLGNKAIIEDHRLYIIVDDEQKDITEYFERENHTIVCMQIDDPYLAVSYDDGVCYIFTGYKPAEYNYYCIYGHSTRGRIVAMDTDDTTGQGILFYDYRTKKTYKSSFTPDTILSYPDNTLFTLLEYKIAQIITGLLGMDSSFVDKLEEQAEIQFYKHLPKTDITNGHTMKGGYYVV